MVRRFLSGVVMLLVAVLLTARVYAQVMIPDPCRGLGPMDPAYWLYSCWLYPTAQFVGEVFSPSHPQFLVR